MIQNRYNQLHIAIDPEQITEIDDGVYTVTLKNVLFSDLFGTEEACAITPGEIAIIRLGDIPIAVRIVDITEYYCARNRPEVLRLSFICKLISKEEQHVTSIPALVVNKIFVLNDMLMVVYCGDFQTIFKTPELYQTEFVEKCTRVSYLGTEYHMCTDDPENGIHGYNRLNLNYIEDGFGNTKTVPAYLAVLYTSKETYSIKDARALMEILLHSR